MTTIGSQGPQGPQGCPAEIACLHTNSDNPEPNAGFDVELMNNYSSRPSTIVPFDLCPTNLRSVCIDEDGTVRMTDPGRYNIYFHGTVMVQYNDTVPEDLATTPPNTIFVVIYVNGQKVQTRAEMNLVTVPNSIIAAADGSMVFYQPISITENMVLAAGDKVQVLIGMINGFGNIESATLLNSYSNFTVNGLPTSEGASLIITKTRSDVCTPASTPYDLCQQV